MSPAPRQHTPGPWKVGGKAGLYCDDVQITSDKEPVAIAVPRRSYCIMSLARRPPEELAANALLIASAPDLLAAAELAVAWAEQVPAPYRDWPHIDSARAAIAKATGGAA